MLHNLVFQYSCRTHLSDKGCTIAQMRRNSHNKVLRAELSCDEFVIVLPNTGKEGATTMARKLRDLVREMASYWTEFCSTLMAQILERVAPDMLHFSEDMAYKSGSMISKEMLSHLISRL